MTTREDPDATLTEDPAADLRSGRVVWIDLARGGALLGMVVFHFGVDLELFGHLAPGTTRSGGWAVFARLVAGSFLFVAGISLYLAHGKGIRWRAFWRRFAVLAVAAAGISLATWIAVPQAFIFFGILHSIAVASLVGLAFLRIPAGVTLAAAAGVLALPRFYSAPLFDAPLLWWTGLSTFTPASLDFEPVFPWLAPCLAGIALARIGARTGLWDALRSRPPAPQLLNRLACPGRNSLLIYLVHQPVLIAIVWVATWIAY